MSGHIDSEGGSATCRLARENHRLRLKSLSMASQPHSFTTQRERSEDPRSPVQRLLFVSSQGMVFKSRSLFESGTRLAIGLHLRKICGDLGLSKKNGEDCTDLYGDRFLKLEGLVADCKLDTISPLDQNYQVTLIFDNLSEADRLLLAAVERSRDASKLGAGVSSAPVGNQPLEFPVPRGGVTFPGMGGLN